MHPFESDCCIPVAFVRSPFYSAHGHHCFSLQTIDVAHMPYWFFHCHYLHTLLLNFAQRGLFIRTATYLL